MKPAACCKDLPKDFVETDCWPLLVWVRVWISKLEGTSKIIWFEEFELYLLHKSLRVCVEVQTIISPASLSHLSQNSGEYVLPTVLQTGKQAQ